ncbi:MAG TPA: hypothetical protein VKE74_12840 [Gemmataceae bacterium]|nr:hypothetical protein [Gemmataceae bacterium]
MFTGRGAPDWRGWLPGSPPTVRDILAAADRTRAVVSAKRGNT